MDESGLPLPHPRSRRGADPALTAARERLSRHRSTDTLDVPYGAQWQAATAVVVAPGPSGLEIAIIQRTERVGDRWSGHMALPGGKRDPTDADLAATAIRETHEEVGLRLPPPDARLDDHVARTRPGRIASFAFTLDRRPAMVPQPSEVAAAWWVPLVELTDPANVVEHHQSGVVFPGIAHRDQVIWGLTHRTLHALFSALGHLDPRT